MEGVGSFVRRYRNGGWEVSERLYGAVGENSIDFWKNSIDFPRILYRLFPDISVQPLERHRINDLFVWDQRFVCMGSTICLYGSNDLIVWEHRSASSVEKGTKVRGNKGEGAQRCGGFPIEIWGNVRKSNGESAQMWGGLCVGCRVKVQASGSMVG